MLCLGTGSTGAYLGWKQATASKQKDLLDYKSNKEERNKMLDEMDTRMRKEKKHAKTQEIKTVEIEKIHPAVQDKQDRTKNEKQKC